MAGQPGPTTGGWYVEIDLDASAPHIPASMATATARACGELSAARLLLPRRCILDRWIRATSDGFAPVSVGRSEHEVGGLLEADDIIGWIAQASPEPETSIPQLSVTGDTEVTAEDDSVTLRSDIMTLDVIYDGVGLTVSLSTSSMVWAPYDSGGRPQHELARRNAPRLAAGLSRLADALQAPIVPMSATRYAVSTEGGLRNHRYHDGTPADVDRWTT